MASNFNEKIVQKLHCSKLDLTDYTLADQNLIQCPLDNGRHCTTAATCGLGKLESLPLELLNDILIHVDLRSLTDFRRVNRRAMEVVDSIPQYKIIVSHALSALRGILAIETGRWISCVQLYAALCTANCEYCNEFGGYLYLITCKRVCFLCFTEDRRLIPLLSSEVIKKYAFDENTLSTSPHLRSLPGYYAHKKREYTHRLTLFDYQSARLSGLSLHGSESQMDRQAHQVHRRLHRQYRESLRRWEKGLLEQKPLQGDTDDPFERDSLKPRCFMAVVPAPWFDPRTRSLSWGLYCNGCRREYMGRPLHFNRKYTSETFIHHIEEYGDINSETGRHFGKEARFKYSWRIS